MAIEEGTEDQVMNPKAKERPASVMVCANCGATLIAARSGSGSVLLKCPDCKARGGVRGAGIAELPVREDALDRARQIAVFPNPPGERGKGTGEGKADSKITRSSGLTVDQAEVVDSALSAWKLQNQVEGKKYNPTALVMFCALYLHGLSEEDLDRFGVSPEVRKMVAEVIDLKRLRDSQLSLLPAGVKVEDAYQEPDEDEDPEDGEDCEVEDDLEDDPPAEEFINSVCDHAMRLVLLDKGEVSVDDLRGFSQDGAANGNALKSLERGGFLTKADQRPSRRPESKGRLIWIFRATGKSYLQPAKADA